MNQGVSKPEPMTLGRFWQGLKTRDLNCLDERTMLRAYSFGLLDEAYCLMRCNGLFHQGKLRAKITGNLMVLHLGQPTKTRLDMRGVLMAAGIKEPFAKFNSIFHTRTRKSARKIERKLRVAQ